jgi:MFS transporter, ACS family, glucarate transporter
MMQGYMPVQSSEAGTRVRFRVMLFLCVLSFLTYYDRQCIVRAQESIQTSLSISDGQMGIVFGAFWLAYALFEIPGGWMGDRTGARFTITRIVLAWSLFTALTGAATGFYSLLVYRFLFGVGEAGAYPNMARIQSRWLPITERARAGGLLWLSARWGAAFAPVIFGTMTRGIGSLQASLGDTSIFGWLVALPAWRIAFFASGVLGVVWCLAFYPWFRDEPSQKESVSPVELHHIVAGRGPMEADHGGNIKVWARLFSSPSLWALALYYFCGSIGWSFFVSWMPRYMKDVQHVSFDKSEWSSALPLICGGIACFVGGVLSDGFVKRSGRRRLGRAVFPVTGCLVAAAAMLAIQHAETALSATILMCVAATAFDFGQAATWASMVDIGGRNAGIAIGFVNMVGCLAHAAQPYVGQLVFNTFSWNALFGVYAVAYLIAMTTWVVINPTRTFYYKRQSEPAAVIV